jgi:hybrid cluster-associated redox disulfide protein
MTQENKITKEMTFGEVLSMYPETVKTFFMYGMHCFGCHLAVDETIEQGALAHGVDVDKLVEDLNQSISLSPEEVKDTSAEQEKKES